MMDPLKKKVCTMIGVAHEKIFMTMEVGYIAALKYFGSPRSPRSRPTGHYYCKEIDVYDGQNENKSIVNRLNIIQGGREGKNQKQKSDYLFLFLFPRSLCRKQ